MIPLVYHPLYNITAFGLERRHPFDSRKYRRIHDALIGRGLRREVDFVRPRPATIAELRRVHSAEYLASLRRSEVLATIFAVPLARIVPGWLLDWRVLRSMRLATGGTLLACRLALEHGIAINLGGGFHHASAGRGGGFCAYADTPIAAATINDEGRIKRLLVVDLDAHQGNGTAAVVRDWPWAAMFDVFEDDLFPPQKEPEAYPHPVQAGLSGTEYLDLVANSLPRVLDEYRPDFVVYNAGSDPYRDDPLADLSLSKEEMAERDLLVVTLVRERKIPIAMVLSGGYAADSWRVHTDAIEGILTRFDSQC
jgi:histone deacetylase 11